MKQVYHCTPVQFRRIPWADINETLTVMRIEAEIDELKSRTRR